MATGPTGSAAYMLDEAQRFQQQIARLKTIAPQYPAVYTEAIGTTIWATTMVAFVYGGVQYLRHHVQSLMACTYAGKEDLLARLHKEAQLTQKYAIPCSLDNIVGPVHEQSN